MKYIYLTDICRPKQWKTISTSDLHESGYPVYGANGKIGFYDKYTHEFPTVLITCRGATCGTLNISEPKSYVNGNAMALDNLNDNYSLKYLYYILIARGLNDVVSGSAQPQITRENLSKVKIPNPSFPTQQKIANILDKADELRQYNKQLIEKYEALTQSLFLDMFGDPVKNENGWELKTLGDIVDFLTSGSRGWAKYYSNEGDIFLRIQNVGYNKLRLDDICYINTPNTAEAIRTKVLSGDIVLSITADLGRTAVIPDNFPNAFINQHLAILRLSKENNPIFVSAFIASSGGQTLFNKLDKGGVKAGLNFTDIKSYNIFCPPIELQNQFAERVAIIETQKQQAQEAFAKSEVLFQGLLQQAFNGELK